MKKSIIKSWSLLFSLLFIITTITACGIKDKKEIISKNISNEAKVAKIEVQRDIELGNKYLQEGKYDKAKNCNGTAEQYERPVKLTLNVQPEISVKPEPNVKPENGITYTNSQYNFELQLPNIWKDKYVVSESIEAIDHGEKNNVIEKSIIFSLKVDEHHVCRIFSIYVYKEPVTKDYIDTHDNQYIYLNTNGNKTFVTMHVTGPEGILLDGKHDSAYKTMKTMINDDYLKIIKTFKFNKKRQ